MIDRNVYLKEFRLISIYSINIFHFTTFPVKAIKLPLSYSLLIPSCGKDGTLQEGINDACLPFSKSSLPSSTLMTFDFA